MSAANLNKNIKLLNLKEAAQSLEMVIPKSYFFHYSRFFKKFFNGKSDIKMLALLKVKFSALYSERPNKKRFTNLPIYDILTLTDSIRNCAEIILSL